MHLISLLLPHISPIVTHPLLYSYHHTNLKLVTWQFAWFFSFLFDSPRPLSHCHQITWPDLSWDSRACVSTLVFSWLRLFLDWRCVEVGACCYWSSIVRQYHICNVLCTVPPGVQYTRIQYRIGFVFNDVFSYSPFRKWSKQRIHNNKKFSI